MRVTWFDDTSVTFYWAIDCPSCDETSYHGPNVSLLSHQGYPAIPIDMGAHDTYDCDHCGALIDVDELTMWTNAREQ